MKYLNKIDFKHYLKEKFGYKGAWYRINNLEKMRWREIQKISEETNIPIEALKNSYTLNNYFILKPQKVKKK